MEVVKCLSNFETNMAGFKILMNNYNKHLVDIFFGLSQNSFRYRNMEDASNIHKKDCHKHIVNMLLFGIYNAPLGKNVFPARSDFLNTFHNQKNPICLRLI